MRAPRPPRAFVPVTLLLAAAVVGLACAATRRGSPDVREEKARSRAAFADVARVLRHPRCLNCHPSDDVPRVGDEAWPHPMNVQRGFGGRGMPAMHCATCHRDANQDPAGVPGAPGWHLAPRSMGWQGLDDHELAEALKDRRRNGGRSLEAMLEHMAEDPLVGWGWAPGSGRSTPPLSREATVAAFRTWIETGAHVPPPGTTATR